MQQGDSWCADCTEPADTAGQAEAGLALFARVRDYDKALEALRVASHIDLDDLTGTSASGLHLATMGGVWQALVFGFASMRARAGQLHIDPRLPPAWGVSRSTSVSTDGT